MRVLFLGGREKNVRFLDMDRDTLPVDFRLPVPPEPTITFDPEAGPVSTPIDVDRFTRYIIDIGTARHVFYAWDKRSFRDMLDTWMNQALGDQL